MGVGLPGEGDRALGHLGHDRLLRRPGKLDELGSSGRGRTSIFWRANRKRVVKLDAEERRVRFVERRGATLAGRAARRGYL